jgi:hypothetical protein
MALLQRFLTHADWERVDAEVFKAAYRPKDMPFLASWVLHGLGAADFRRVRDAVAGRPLELVWRLLWRRPFERRQRAAFRYV